jgi:hypothetical protein
MAMNAAAMASAVVSAVKAALAVYENPPDDERATGYDLDSYLNAVWLAACTQIVNHISANAKATGTDSRGDTHNLDVA